MYFSLLIFHYRKRLFPVCLNFCRVLFFEHTAKALFVVCLVIKHTANKTHSANSNFRRVPAHGEQPFSPCAEAPAQGETKTRARLVLPRQAPSLGLTDVSVCRVPREAHGEHHHLPCAPSLAHGKKQPLPCATLEHTTNLIKMF